MDWNKLREDFFSECVDRRGLDLGVSPKINMHPHNLFEWFKKHLQQFESKMEKEHYPEENKYSKLFEFLKQEANWTPLTSDMDELVSIIKGILQSESGKREEKEILQISPREEKSQVLYPIGMDSKVSRGKTYCYCCGKTVRSQKYCHGCGRKLIWENIYEETLKINKDYVIPDEPPSTQKERE